MIWLFQAQFSSKVTLEMKYLSSVCRRENISRVLKFSSILSTESLFYRIVLGTVDHIGLNRQEKKSCPAENENFAVWGINCFQKSSENMLSDGI